MDLGTSIEVVVGTIVILGFCIATIYLIFQVGSYLKNKFSKK